MHRRQLYKQNAKILTPALKLRMLRTTVVGHYISV